MSNIGILSHSGFISNIHKDDLTLYHTTTENDEIITFKDANGRNLYLNSLTIESDSTDLYIQLLPSDYCIFIPASGSVTVGHLKINQIKVLGELGKSLRWYGLFY